MRAVVRAVVVGALLCSQRGGLLVQLAWQEWPVEAAARGG